MSIENPNFLKKKYDLHASEEVESAAERTERLTGEKVPVSSEARIQNYLDRFKEITERTDSGERERGLEALKRVLHKQFVIRAEEIPEGYYENQRRLAREQGHGDIEISPEMRKQLAEVVVTDQKTTLNNWVDYLASPHAPYPDWLKYYAFRSMLGLSTFDKEKHEFGKRGKGTTAPFPDLNREALAYVLDAIEKKYDKKIPQLDALEAPEREQFMKLLQSENFGKLYAWAIEKVTPAQPDQLTITEGKWVKYSQNSDHMPLVESLQGHGTGWCTAGESTAEAQLKNGDFYVYYSHDANGQPTIPRAAIRMEGENIAEVRGIAAEQNLDSYIGEVVESKLIDFGKEGEAYQKKSADMRQLTALEKKTKQGEKLTKDELTFLYEIESPIEGFGYQRDPRIDELRAQRNAREDAPLLLNCASEEIAWSKEEINENTKAYIGPLFPGIFTQLQHMEHIYTAFPENPIRFSSIAIGTLSKEQLRLELENQGFKISISANDLLQTQEFTINPTKEKLDLVHLSVADLGFKEGARYDAICARALELGLELCPAEVGPQLRLQYLNQPRGEWVVVAMEAIRSSDGYLSVFRVVHGHDGRWLHSLSGYPDNFYVAGFQFVFRLPRKQSSAT